jgi:hypothetical protein
VAPRGPHPALRPAEAAELVVAAAADGRVALRARLVFDGAAARLEPLPEGGRVRAPAPAEPVEALTPLTLDLRRPPLSRAPR